MTTHNSQQSIQLKMVTVIPALLSFVLWWVIAHYLDSKALPAPNQVFTAFLFHFTEGQLVSDVWATLVRVFASFSVAMALGVIIGTLLGRRQFANQLFDPLVLFFLNLPALVVVMLSFVWLGLTELAAITAVIINKLPLVIINVREGARVIDNQLLEVAEVYKVPPLTRLLQVFLPQLYPHILSSARNGLALIWKIVLVVELLGRSDGIGFSLHSMFQFFDIAGILAYAFTFMLLMFMVDWLLFKPFERRIQRGRK